MATGDFVGRNGGSRHGDGMEVNMRGVSSEARGELCAALRRGHNTRTGKTRRDGCGKM